MPKTPDIAAVRLDKVRAAGLGNIFFAWAGGFEKGQPHYYRIQGPSFLVEYDNVQNNANHIHTVWRDLNADFGADLLALHDVLNRLQEIDPDQSRIVELRFFGGLTIKETAEVMQISHATVEREWRLAKAFIKLELTRVNYAT